MRLSGGRTWWAHFEFTRINIEPIILRKKIEDVREAGAALLDQHRAVFLSFRPSSVPSERLHRLHARRTSGRNPACAQGDDHQRSEEHTSELQSLAYLVCRLLLEKKKKYQ